MKSKLLKIVYSYTTRLCQILLQVDNSLKERLSYTQKKPLAELDSGRLIFCLDQLGF